jgi:hypothetical protein
MLPEIYPVIAPAHKQTAVSAGFLPTALLATRGLAIFLTRLDSFDAGVVRERAAARDAIEF